MISATVLLNHKTVITNSPIRQTFSSSLRSIMSASAQSFQQPRLVAKKVLAKPQSEGEGALVRRSIGRCALISSNPKLFNSPVFFYFISKSNSLLQLVAWVVIESWFWFDLVLKNCRPELKSLDPFLMLDEFSGTPLFYFYFLNFFN